MKPDTRALLRLMKFKSPAAAISRYEHLKAKGLIPEPTTDDRAEHWKQVVSLLGDMQLREERRRSP